LWLIFIFPFFKHKNPSKIGFKMVKMYAHYMWIKIIIIIRIRSVVHAHSRKFTQHCYAKFICPRSHLLLLFSVLLLTSSEVRLKRSFRFRKMAVNVWEVGQKKRKCGKIPLCLQTNQLELPFHFAFSCHFIFFCKFTLLLSPLFRHPATLLWKNPLNSQFLSTNFPMSII